MKAPKVTAGQRRNLRVRALAVATLHRLWATLDVPDQRALEGVISAAEKLHTSAEESIARTEAFAALHSMMVADLIPETRDWQISLNGVKVCKVRFGHTCDAALKKAMSRLYMAGWRASMSVEDAMRPALPSRLILARRSSEWRYWTRRHLYDRALYAQYRRHVPRGSDSPRAREWWGIEQDAPDALVYPDD